MTTCALGAGARPAFPYLVTFAIWCLFVSTSPRPAPPSPIPHSAFGWLERVGWPSRAGTHRPKLIAIGEDGSSETHVPTLSSSELLTDVQRRIAKAVFTGGDNERRSVVQQFQRFSSIILRGVAQGAAAGKRSAKVASE